MVEVFSLSNLAFCGSVGVRSTELIRLSYAVAFAPPSVAFSCCSSASFYSMICKLAYLPAPLWSASSASEALY